MSLTLPAHVEEPPDDKIMDPIRVLGDSVLRLVLAGLTVSHHASLAFLPYVPDVTDSLNISNREKAASSYSEANTAVMLMIRETRE
jgi:hypothetical protein